MKVFEAAFVKSCLNHTQYPKHKKPEIAFVGRSNVGKSSLINCLLNKRNLAKTSSRPGKTQMLNFYKVNNGAFFFVDLPGYGFAKVSKKKKEQWGIKLEEYLKNRKNLTGVVQLVDIRHPPTEDDILMYDWLKYYRINTIVCATKADKISRGQWNKHLKVIEEMMKIQSGDKLITFSALNKEGREELLRLIGDLLTTKRNSV
ncbi:MAG: GTP-binding protein [Thermosediminibacterales bacterium]|nr:GTP-binding protein [Thermosediminibacterales bacterium]MDK2835736.1 GTP-binding protein [Thermosediminibacterales bacterium]